MSACPCRPLQDTRIRCPARGVPACPHFRTRMSRSMSWRYGNGDFLHGGDATHWSFLPRPWHQPTLNITTLSGPLGFSSFCPDQFLSAHVHPERFGDADGAVRVQVVLEEC